MAHHVFLHSLNEILLLVLARSWDIMGSAIGYTEMWKCVSALHVSSYGVLTVFCHMAFSPFFRAAGGVAKCVLLDCMLHGSMMLTAGFSSTSSPERRPCLDVYD